MSSGVKGRNKTYPGVPNIHSCYSSFYINVKLKEKILGNPSVVKYR